MKNRKSVLGSLLVLLLLIVAILAINKVKSREIVAVENTTTLEQPSTNQEAAISVVEGEKRVLRWQSFLEQTGISYETIIKVAPHFPNLSAISQPEEFDQWIDTYPEEVVQFMQLPSVKQKQPSKIALGINHIDTRTEIQHPYWYRYKLMDREAKQLLPNFPQPDPSLSIAEQEAIFKVAFNQWSQDFPKEFEAMMQYFYPGYSGEKQAPTLDVDTPEVIN